MRYIYLLQVFSSVDSDYLYNSVTIANNNQDIHSMSGKKSSVQNVVRNVIREAYGDTSADIILASDDGHHFYVHSYMLKAVR
jgi:hypothetical protein